MFRKISVLFLLCLCGMPARSGWAEPDLSAVQSQLARLSETVRALTLKVDEQAREISTLKAAREVPPAPAPVSAPAPSTMPKFLEIGAVADVAMKLDSPKTDEGGADRVSVRELELVLGAVVDPFTRLDSTVAFNEDGTAELEEAYATRFELPLDTTARIGRFKPRIGKVLATHRDALDTVDEPLVIQRYFGQEGMSKSGVDVKKILDLPLPSTHELTFGVLEGGNGEGGTAFGDTHRRPTLYAHLKNYFDLDDMTGLEVGLTDAAGSRDADSAFEVNVLGIDGTLIRHLNANQDLKLQGEVFNINRRESQVETTDDAGEIFLNNLDGNVWGGYLLFDFRMSSQWAAGFRWDDVDLIDRPVDSPNHHDMGYSGYLTFYQSEFARWRAQFTHLDLTDGHQDNQVWLQGTFAIGEHKHKLS